MAHLNLPVLSANSSARPGPMDSAGLGADGGYQDFCPDTHLDDCLINTSDNHLFTVDLDTYSTTFEDPFNYPQILDTAPQPGETAYHDDESSPQRLRNDEMLAFTAAPVGAHLIDATMGQLADVNMTAELYGMFFVAENVFSSGPDETSTRPLELTCYRRNLWQCSGNISLPCNIDSVYVVEQDRTVAVTELYASIGAVESIDGKPTEIIAIPWKSGNASQAATDHRRQQETRRASAPPRIPLVPSVGQEGDGEPGQWITIPVAWKRLQFRSATANNGRRKGTQQHYRVKISLQARKAGNIPAEEAMVTVAEMLSSPVIVRGRSPRNFNPDINAAGMKRDGAWTAGDKKTGSGGSSSAERVGGPARAQSDPSLAPNLKLKLERSDAAQSLQRCHTTPVGASGASGVSGASGAGEWLATGTGNSTFIDQSRYEEQQRPGKRVAISPSANRAPVSIWTTAEPSTSSSAFPGGLEGGIGSSRTIATPPISLPLSEEERYSPRHRSVSEAGVDQSTRSMGSPMEEDEQLYEYFPLSTDDWTPLVDTVYRLHIVHHTSLPQEIKPLSARSKAKRYFSAE